MKLCRGDKQRPKRVPRRTIHISSVFAAFLVEALLIKARGSLVIIIILTMLLRAGLKTLYIQQAEGTRLHRR